MKMNNLKLVLEHTKPLKVLYVEDDEALLKTTRELLSNYFSHVDVASNGEEGLERYLAYEEKTQSPYDLIITDINMPKMSGIEMSKQIRKHSLRQAIVITTAHNEIEYLLSAIEIDVDGFITKPINNEQLMQTLYKVSLSISDHKFFLEHVDMIENLNLQLEEKNRVLASQNSELEKKNSELEKSFRMLDTMISKEQTTHHQDKGTSSDEEKLNEKFLQEQVEQLVSSDLYELIELHNEIDLNIIKILNSKQSIDLDSLSNLITLFKRYSAVLKYYNFFDKLSTSMADFSLALKENNLPEDREHVQNIFMLLESFTYVLGKWQNDLNVCDIQQINALDASLISDMHTIVNMYTQVEEEFSEDDMDSIFDF